jgi:hypothetical protein
MGRMVKVALGNDVLSAEIRAEATLRIHRNVDIDMVLINMSVGTLFLSTSVIQYSQQAQGAGAKLSNSAAAMSLGSLGEWKREVL